MSCDEIDLVGQVAVAECLGQIGDFIERQPAAGIDDLIEIGIAPRAAGRPRAERPFPGALRRTAEGYRAPAGDPPADRQATVASCEPALQFCEEVLGFLHESRDTRGDRRRRLGVVSVAVRARISRNRRQAGQPLRNKP